ncbi:SulP family inorganic anion transporter [Paenibacillus apiarius]|uniref:SulP family inorganic anion transporter n=1 Tax=Paenibacillus apiarius TaxID=46240 RepID=A0ABT4DV97_9BACL|nr:SulP family inorganic anion transporter [Paenibacillus apiarius]MCY9514845.1 SulP family inorganic anion transporter [Paenibacillus apiarius]MCY9521275.1 SulP family inorganic anion transporter [Paenibacillus apiarius]MCY9553991.1 SulP family inorganic anion transporter [Paenibacillus apiarius]MCY9560365.1 SulP family inorganic anion transporter [Paenibacillus apiarius]MCY9682297.1 SulP family inorganic anion transporter [Paenibacillus apiarius]
MVKRIQTEWLSNVRADILSGIVVALALIPEAIAFSIIAGVDPMVGLYASFCIAVIIAFVGGRPGMISAATGAMALLMAPLVKEHGLNYLLAATILTGIIQIVFGVCKVAQLMKFIPRAVMIGFVNALAILIFMAQVPHFIGISTLTYVFVGLTLLIVYTVPRFFKAIPAPLIAIIILTAAAIMGKLDLGTVGDLGNITQTLPSFLIPDVPFDFDTLAIIFPYSLALAVVGLLESLLTSSIVDEMTDTSSNKNREARGQGIANVINGFFGGMAGCAMIGQSVINVKSGGRSRLSTLVAGMFLMFLIIVLGELVVQIPMPVLAGIMIMVSIGTFDWSSFTYLRKAPKTDALVMLTTVIIVVVTHDLSKGVIAGVLLSAIFFVAKISKIKVRQKQVGDKQLFQVEGQLFFASTNSFVDAFDLSCQGQEIVIDFSNAHIWDDSGVGAIDKVAIKYQENNNKVTIKGLNSSSKSLVERLAIYHDQNAKLAAH